MLTGAKSWCKKGAVYWVFARKQGVDAIAWRTPEQFTASGSVPDAAFDHAVNHHRMMLPDRYSR